MGSGDLSAMMDGLSKMRVSSADLSGFRECGAIAPKLSMVKAMV